MIVGNSFKIIKKPLLRKYSHRSYLYLQTPPLSQTIDRMCLSRKTLPITLFTFRIDKIEFIFYYISFGLQNNIMEESLKDGLSNRQAKMIQRYRQRIKQIEDEAITRKIVQRDTNSLDFYKITPKDELPIYLQKMRFQTLHLKQKDITSSIKVFKKENVKPTQKLLRKKLRDAGNFMLLSEIYQNLGQSGQLPKSRHNHLQEQTTELDQWEKTHKNVKVDSLERKSSKENVSLICLTQAYDYKAQIERGLQIIDVTHGSENNLLNRYLLIENSSKLLKKDLQEKKIQVEENIKSRMKLLYQARTEYHNCFEEKNRLYLEEKLLREEPKDDVLRMSHKSLTSKGDKSQKKSLIEANEIRIGKIKKNIESLEEAIASQEEQLKKIMQAEQTYYKNTLKNGSDVRQSGLVWVIQKLKVKEDQMSQFEFPAYLDRKSRLFLIHRSANQEEQEQLLEQKRRFVNQIGRTTTSKKLKSRNIFPKESTAADRIIQADFRLDSDIPKKYRKSLRKLSALAQEFAKNSSLLEGKGQHPNREVEISADLDGMTHKQIYSQVGERIKKLDLTKIKKEKLGAKGAQLMQYQNLLQKIKNGHIHLEEMDLQHQNYLLGQYRDNRNLFFMQAAACFGYKRAYSMIIKHYSWKNYSDHHLPKRSE